MLLILMLKLSPVAILILSIVALIVIVQSIDWWTPKSKLVDEHIAAGNIDLAVAEKADEDLSKAEGFYKFFSDAYLAQEPCDVEREYNVWFIPEGMTENDRQCAKVMACNRTRAKFNFFMQNNVPIENLRDVV